MFMMLTSLFLHNFVTFLRLTDDVHDVNKLMYIFKVHFVFTDTPRHDIEEAFRGFLKRDDIAIILINQMVRI
jgi:hypothetical protein